MAARRPARGGPKSIIAAAVDVAYGGEPPDELRVEWICKRYHCPPSIALEQDAAQVLRQACAGNAYDTFSRYESLQGAQIHTLTEGERRILRYLIDEGMM